MERSHSSQLPPAKASLEQSSSAHQQTHGGAQLNEQKCPANFRLNRPVSRCRTHSNKCHFKPLSLGVVCYTAIADSNKQLYFDTENTSKPPSQINSASGTILGLSSRILGPLPAEQSLRNFGRMMFRGHNKIKPSRESYQSIREKGQGRKADAR